MKNPFNINLNSLPQKLRNIILENLNNSEIVMLEVRDFSQTNTIDYILEKIENYGQNLPKKLKKRLFQITVELVQNIFRHANNSPEEIAHKFPKLGFYILAKISNFAYRITTGNFVDKKKKEYLQKYLSKIQKLNSQQIKELYYDILNNKEFNFKGGGGLGFIEIAKKSNSNFEFKFIKYNLDLYIFLIYVTISIENQ